MPVYFDHLTPSGKILQGEGDILQGPWLGEGLHGAISFWDPTLRVLIPLDQERPILSNEHGYTARE